MKSSADQWIDEVLQSTQGSRRAQPDPALWLRVQAAVEAPDVPLIPLRRIRLAAAAAAVLVLLNVAALFRYARQTDAAPPAPTATLLTDFQLYD